MLIAKINNPVPVDYKQAFPNTSFPPSGPSDEFLAEQGFAKVNAFKKHNRATQKLVTVSPYYEAPWVYTINVVDKTVEEIAADKKSKVPRTVTMRQGRLALLAAGLLDQVETALSAIPDETDRRMAQIEWEYAQTIDRNSTWVSNLADSLGLSDDQLDDLFTAASTI